MGILLSFTSHWVLALVVLLLAAGAVILFSTRLLLNARVDETEESFLNAAPAEEVETRRPERAPEERMKAQRRPRRYGVLGDLDEDSPAPSPAPEPEPAPSPAAAAAPAPEPRPEPEPEPRPLPKPAPVAAEPRPLPEPEPVQAAPAAQEPPLIRPFSPAQAVAAEEQIPILRMRTRARAAASPDTGLPAMDAIPPLMPAASAAPAAVPPPVTPPTAQPEPRPRVAPPTDELPSRPRRSSEPSAAVTTRPERPARTAPARPAEPRDSNDAPARSRRQDAGQNRQEDESPRSSRDLDETPFQPQGSGRASGILAREIRLSFRGAFQYLANHTDPNRAGGEIPLYLVLGPPLAGKSTLLNQATLPWKWRQTQRTFGSTTGMMWKFSEPGILLELPGSYLMDRGEGYTAWRRVIPLLQRYRPRRPLDGLVLVLPADLLLESRPEMAGERDEALRTMQTQLDRLSQSIGMRLPLYLIISKCDGLPGFGELLQALPPHNRQNALGWTNPDPASDDFDATRVADGLHEVRQGLLRLQAETAMEQADPEQFARQLGLLEAFQRLTERLNAAALTLMGSDRASAFRTLRGIYFYGAAGPASTPREADAAPEKSLQAAVKRRFTARPNRELALIQQLFPRRIFPEWGLARPTANSAILRHPMARMLQLATAGLALVLTGLTVWGWMSLTRIRDRQVMPLVRLLHPTSAAASPVAILSGMAQSGRTPLRSWGLPASLLPGVQSSLEQQMTQTLETTVYPGLVANLQAQGKALADHWAIVASNPPASTPATPVTSPVQLPEFQTLHRFTQDWEQLQNRIDLYQNLARTDHPATPEELERFLKLMGAPATPPLTAGSPLLRVVRRAHGSAYAYPAADARRASQEMQNLVRHLLYRWYLENALIQNLQALGKLPADPEYDIQRSQLASRVRMELTNTRLAGTLRKDQRLSGPLYAVTLGAVHRSGYMTPDLRDFIDNETEADEQQVQAILQQLRSPLGHPLVTQQGNQWQLAPELQ